MELSKLYVIPDCSKGRSDSAAIQTAVDEAARLAPGENLDFSRRYSSAWKMDTTVDEWARLASHPVLIPRKPDGSAWKLDSTILLHDYTTVILDGCTIECAGTAFKNERADDPRTKSLGGEQREIRLIGRSGAVIRSCCAPQIRLSNARDFLIRGITFAGGKGLELNFARVFKVQKLRFEDSEYGISMSAGCSGAIVEDIDAVTRQEAIRLEGGEDRLFGRDPDIRKSIIARVRARTQGASAVTMRGGKVPLAYLILRDVTDLTEGEGASVTIGGASDAEETRDLSVRGVDSRRTAVAAECCVDGLYLGNLRGKTLFAPAVESTRVYLDKKQMDIALPRKDESVTDASALSANDPAFFAATDAKTIQNAVDAASARGVNRVVIPRSNARTGKMYWNIDTAIVLPSGMTVELCASHLRQTDYTYSNLFTNAPGAKNIAIIGVGDAVLDGGRHNGLKENNAGKYGFGEIQCNAALRFEGVEGLRLEDFQINQSRWYGIYCFDCRGGRIADVDFLNHAVIPDLGGVLLAPGCRDFVIEDLTGKLGENGVRLCATALYGLPENGPCDISNICIRDLKMNNCRSDTVSLLSHDGCRISGVTVDGIMDVSLAEQKMVNHAAVVIGSAGGYCKRPGKAGELSGVTVRDVCTRGNTAMEMGGCVDDVEVSDVHSFSGAAASLTVSGRAELRNVHFDGLFFRCQQSSRYMRGTATSIITDKRKYVGTVLDMSMAVGENVLAENVFAERIGNGVKLSGGGSLTVRNFSCAECGKELTVCDASSSLTFNEQEQTDKTVIESSPDKGLWTIT